MDAQEYIETRVDDQIRWYSSHSRQAQQRLKWLQGFAITAAAVIPILAGFGPETVTVKLTIALLSVLIAVSSALVSLNQYQENWIEYRTTAESLKHEKFLFLTAAEPYRDARAFELFVLRIEALISKENSAWSQNMVSATEKAEGK